MASDRLTQKQEDFCRSYVETGCAYDAYRAAYDVSPDTKRNTIDKRAHELLQDGKIAGRVAELQSRAAAKVVLSRAWVLEQLMDNASKAKAAADFTASNKALELLGKTDEVPLFVERSSVTSDNRHHHSAEPVSPFAEFLAGVAGVPSESSSEEPVQN